MRAAGRIGAWGIAALALSLLACSRDWDAFDPRLGTTISTVATGGAGGGTGGDAGAPAAGGGGGEGGGGAGPCGKTSAYGVDFELDVATPYYQNNSSSGYSDVDQGELLLGYGSDPGSFVEVTTERTADFEDSDLFIELVAVDPEGSAQFILEAGSGAIRFRHSVGQLFFEHGVAGGWFELDSMSFDDVDHRWLRFRESAGTTYWETSSDARAWTERASLDSAALGALGFARTRLNAARSPSMTLAGQARFDNVNGGVSTTSWCPIGSFTDAFDDGGVDARWRVAADDAQGSEPDGLSIVLYQDSSFYEYITRSAYDFTEGTVTIEVVTPPEQGRFALTLLYDGYNYAQMDLTTGVLVARIEEQDTTFDLESGPFSPSEQRWWRLRVEDGAVNWETSPDGQEWTNYAVQSSPDFIDEVEVRLDTDGTMTNTAPELLKLDNFNLPP